MNRFALAFREQRQLFLFDPKYAFGLLFRIGGLSTLSARFVVQFFFNPALAVILTAALLLLAILLLFLAVRDKKADWRVLPLCLIPVVFMTASLNDVNLHYDALIAFLLALAGLWVYSVISRRRLFRGSVITLLLYLSAGPAALMFALTALILDLDRNCKLREMVRGMVFLAIGLLCGAFAVWLAWVPTLREAWTPAFFYDIATKMSAAHWLSWGAVPAAVLLAMLTQRGKRSVRLLGNCVLAAASLFFAGRIGDRFLDGGRKAYYEHEFHTVNGRWDALTESCKGDLGNYMTANYFNLSLAEKGTLAEDLFKHAQNGPYSLVYLPKDHAADLRLAHVMFAMGNMAAAQNAAFNALSTQTGYNPSMLKMTAQIDLMRGSYEVAERYLNLLGKSLHYRAWARDQQRFLGNDALLEQDPVLGTGRKDFPKEDGFALHGSPMDELFRVLDANPADEKAMQYGISYLLLSKDMINVCKFIDRYGDAPGLRPLPTPAQEALLFFSELQQNVGVGHEYAHMDIDWCRSHGVMPQTIQRFRDFQNASVKSGGREPAGYRNTFWHYLLYTEIQNEK